MTWFFWYTVGAITIAEGIIGYVAKLLTRYAD